VASVPTTKGCKSRSLRLSATKNSARTVLQRWSPICSGTVNVPVFKKTLQPAGADESAHGRRENRAGLRFKVLLDKGFAGSVRGHSHMPVSGPYTCLTEDCDFVFSAVVTRSAVAWGGYSCLFSLPGRR
jgi:hypothetical protein